MRRTIQICRRTMKTVPTVPHHARQIASLPIVNMHNKYTAVSRPQLDSRWFGSAAGENPVNVTFTSSEKSLEGKVVTWLKAPGDAVQANEVIATIETSEGSIEVIAPSAGTLGEQLFNIDDTIVVGAPLATIIPDEKDDTEEQPEGESTVTDKMKDQFSDMEAKLSGMMDEKKESMESAAEELKEKIFRKEETPIEEAEATTEVSEEQLPIESQVTEKDTEEIQAEFSEAMEENLSDGNKMETQEVEEEPLEPPRSTEDVEPVEETVLAMENIVASTEGTVMEWTKLPGDSIKVDDVLLVLETHDGPVDVRSSFSGILQDHLVAIDEPVLADTLVGTIIVEETPNVEPTGPIHTAVIPSMGLERVKEGTITGWMKAPGDFVDVDEVLATVVDHEHNSVDIRSSFAGVLQEHLVDIDDVVRAGESIATIMEDESARPPVEPQLISVVVPNLGESVHEGQVIQWMVAEGDFVDVDDILGVLEADTQTVDIRAPKRGKIEAVYAQVNEMVQVDTPLVEILTDAAMSEEDALQTMEPDDRPVRREAMTEERMQLIQRLKDAQSKTASVTTFHQVDMGNLMAIHDNYKDVYAEVKGVELNLMSPFIIAASETLLKSPSMNAYIDDETNEIVYRDHVDISVSITKEDGEEVAPVLKNTHLMGFAEIEHHLKDLTSRAKADQLSNQEKYGGTFTITNNPSAMMGTRILNHPQSAVLGIHTTEDRPTVIDGEVLSRPMMYLALTYDHRIVNDTQAIDCLKSIAAKIEDPQQFNISL